MPREMRYFRRQNASYCAMKRRRLCDDLVLFVFIFLNKHEIKTSILNQYLPYFVK